MIHIKLCILILKQVLGNRTLEEGVRQPAKSLGYSNGLFIYRDYLGDYGVIEIIDKGDCRDITPNKRFYNDHGKENGKHYIAMGHIYSGA